MAAAAKVFAVFELAEAILVKLRLMDIMIATQVCLTWRNIIETSSVIRERVYYLPEPLSEHNHDLKVVTINESSLTPWYFEIPFVDGDVVYVLRAGGMEIFLVRPRYSHMPIRILGSDACARTIRREQASAISSGTTRQAHSSLRNG